MLLLDAPQAATGALFGVALTASGVWIPSIILEQFELKNFYMLEVFGVAVGSSALIMLALDRTGVVQRPVRPNSPLGSRWTYGGNLLGGSMVRIGMNLTGACPGTVLVQLAQGVPSAKPTAIGALLGGMAYTYVSPRMRPRCAHIVKATIPQAAHVSESITYALLGAGILGLLAMTHGWFHASSMWSIFGGLAIGATQAVSLLSTSAPLGVSTAYEEGGRYILQVLRLDQTPTPSKVPKATVFAVSMMAGSAAFGTPVLPIRLSSFPEAGPIIPFWQAMIGGFVMIFGARLGGGCTSGHGISGLSALSFSSLVTVVGIFGAGILGRLLTPAMLMV